MPRINLPHLPSIADETLGGIAVRLMSIHYGSAPGQSFPPPTVTPVTSTLFRWNKPLSSDDARGGIISPRTGMWHPRRTVRQSIYGPEGADFAGKTPYERPEEEEEWL